MYLAFSVSVAGAGSAQLAFCGKRLRPRRRRRDSSSPPPKISVATKPGDFKQLKGLIVAVILNHAVCLMAGKSLCE